MPTSRPSSRSTVSPVRPAVRAWWERPGLSYVDGRLQLDDTDLGTLAASAGSPLYVYSAARVRANLERVLGELQRRVSQGRVFYAMKSNRFLPLMMALRADGRCGIDCCSPAELMQARQCGFAEEEITYTQTSMSVGDAEILARHPGVAVNCDSRAGLRQLARVAPGRKVGLRIDPEIGIGYRRNPRLAYAGTRPSKFGILWSEVAAAVAEAQSLGLTIEGLHVHAGCGFLTPQLPVLDRILERLKAATAAVPNLRYVNMGGGLGIPLVSGDRPLDLAAWGQVVARHFGRAKHEVWMEPGDYLSKDAGVLLLTVTGVEQKKGECFVGLDGGFNLHPEPVFYQLPLEPVPVAQPGKGRRRRVTLAGNINEAHDLWACGVLLPEIREGALLALLNAGGYGSAMASDHCRRGAWREYLLWR